MADPIPGTTSVTDKSPRPRGVLPRHAQTWLMAGLAVGMLAIIVFTGHSGPPALPVSIPNLAPLAPDADRLRGYQERLRQLDAQARQESNDPAPTSPSTYRQDASAPAIDPLIAEKKRRDYESLFAGIRVTRRAQGTSRASAGRAEALFDPADVPQLPAVPSIDAITEAVLRATGRAERGASAPPPIPAQVTPSAGDERRTTIAGEDAPAPTSPIGGRHRLTEGTLIPSILTNRLDGSSAAPVNCLVTTPVYTQDGQHLLIPAGARVLGTSKPVQAFGESRLAVTFHRLLMPNEITYPLDRFVGLNQIGDTGLRDQVNQHYLSTFGAAAAVGLLTGLSQAVATAGIGQGDGDRTVILAGGANETTQATSRMVDRLLNRAPTITIREGHRLHVYLTSHLDLPAYDAPRRKGSQ